jgi:Ca2+-binding RTX toxin-like protein
MFFAVADDHYAGTSDFLLSASAAGEQSRPALTALPDGGFVAVWSGTGGVIMQMFDADGQRVGAQTNPAFGGEVAVTALAGGGFVVTYTREDPYPAVYELYGQRFDSAGAAIGAEFHINTATDGFQMNSYVTALAGGGFVVTWEHAENSGYDHVRGQVFAADATRIGAEFIATDAKPGDKILPTAVGLAGGGFVVAWFEYGAEVADQFGNLSAGVRAQLFDAVGNKVGSAFSLNSIVQGTQMWPTLAALPGGGFIAAWTDDGNVASGQPANGNQGVWVQRFDSAGTKIGAAALVSDPGGFAGSLVIEPVEGVGFVVAWRAGAGDLQGQLLDVDGHRIGTGFLVNPGVGGAQFDPDLAVLAGGAFVTAWYASGATFFDGYDARARMFFPIVQGTSGDDVFVGTEGRDYFTGRGGDDHVTGAGGEDGLIGGDGNDTLEGGGGNDFLSGGAGADTLRGGAGDDVYEVDSAGDSVEENPGEGSDEVRTGLAAYTLGANVELLTGTATVGQELTGNGLNNRIVGGTGNDIIDGGAGADVMEGGDGADLYRADDPSDTIVESVGDGARDTVETSLASFTLAANVENLVGQSAGGQTLRGNQLGNVIVAGPGDDILFGEVEFGFGNDVLEGREGNDQLDGGGGADQMIGGPGDDIYFVDSPGDSAEEAADEGYDEVRTGLAFYLLPANIEKLTGTRSFGLASLTGNGLDNVISGLGANDTIDGGAGADSMRGGQGDDVYVVDNAGDMVVENPDEGSDEVRTPLAAYSLAPNVEKLTATSAADHHFRGNSAPNVLTGGAGNDFLLLQDGGADTALGGAGNDVIYFGAALSPGDVADGGPGRDAIVLQGNVTAVLSDTNLVGIESISIQSGANATFGDTANNFYDFNVTTADGNVLPGQQLIVNASSLRAGEDFTFDGSAEHDGKFLVYGGAGVDLLKGGDGVDLFFFEGQRWGPDDRVDGGAGRDALVISAGSGLTHIAFGAASLVNVESISLNSRYASDPSQKPSYELVLANGNVTAGGTLIVNGSSIPGGQVVNIDGRAVTGGNLILFGGGGHDVLSAGDGADLLVGGSGADALTGGAGADIFRYDSASDSAPGLSDLIGDFVSGIDRIDLSRIDANTHVAGDQAFTWIGESAFSGAAGELRTYQAGGYRWVAGDTDGDGNADLVIALQAGTAPLVQGDFLL